MFDSEKRLTLNIYRDISYFILMICFRVWRATSRHFVVGVYEGEFLTYACVLPSVGGLEGGVGVTVRSEERWKTRTVIDDEGETFSFSRIECRYKASN